METQKNSSTLSVAPMMAITDRHYRYFFRLLSRCTKLYTPMIVDDTLLYQVDNLNRFLGHQTIEQPLAVQLGGSDPEKLGKAAGLCQQYLGFDEINLNVGCPSRKVSGRSFGACLMLKPELVREIVYNMCRCANRTEISVKCRIGVDAQDSYENLVQFVMAVRLGGVRHLVVHARKALLNGISTNENRKVPSLRHDIVHQLSKDFSDMTIVLNGGISDLSAVQHHLVGDGTSACHPVSGVMIGRAAYQDPWAFRHADTFIFGANSNPGRTRRSIVNTYSDYCYETKFNDPTTSDVSLMKPLNYLFHGYKGNKAFRICMTETARKNTKKVGFVGSNENGIREAIHAAMKYVPNDILDEPVGYGPTRCQLTL